MSCHRIMLSKASELLVLGLQRGGESCGVHRMISEMAEPNWVKPTGFVEDMGQNNLAKEFF